MSYTCFETEKVHLQEVGCVYRFGIVCCACINISSLIEHTLLPTRLLILMHVKHPIRNVYINPSS